MQLQHSKLLAVLVTWAVFGQVSECSSQDLIAKLAEPSNDWAPTTVISFPGSPDFTNATQRWAVYAPPSYFAAISPGTEADVVKSVKLATSYRAPFLATGGRHGYTTSLGQLHHGLAVDLSQLNSVVVDRAADTVTVGGGVRVGQIFDPVYNAGFELQTVTSQCPGMIGGTLGAGVGRDEGRYGLVIDALRSVRIVTADAKLIEASETSHPDLFWAIRGAGANFGVITSATYKLHKISDQADYNGWATCIDFEFHENASISYFDAIVDSYHGSLPARMSAETIIRYDAETNNPSILANWVYFGSEQQAREALAPILKIQAINVSIKFVPWSQLANTFLFGKDPTNCPGNRNESVYGGNMRVMSPSTYQAAFEKMVQLYADHPHARKSMLSLEMFSNHAAKAVPDDTTAYPWRDTVAHFLVLMIEAGEAGEQLGRQLRDDFAKTSGYGNLSVYVSYARGDEKLEQIYGVAQLPRLAALKKKWDPSNVFGFNNALPTSYPHVQT